MRKRIISLVMTLVFTLTITNVAALANYYGEAKNSSTGLDGSFFRTTIKAMDSKFTSSNHNFILHSTWLNTDNNGSWIEVGFNDGDWFGASTSYRGHYTAFYKYDSSGNLVSETYKKITGPSTDVNTVHTYQVQRDGTNTWGVYVDYVLRQTYTSGSGSVGSNPDVGLEANNTASTSAQWNDRNFQIYKNSTWSTWTSGDLYNDGNASVSWDTKPSSIFSSQN